MTQIAAPPLDPDQPGFVAPGTEVSDLPNEAPQVQMDYFGFSASDKWYLPDGISWMLVSAMNEGAKSKFQKKTQRDVVLERGTGNAKFNVDPSVERHAIIMESVVDWNLTRGGVQVPISTNAQGNKRNLADWLELTDPKLVESLEDFIRKLNPWLNGEMTVVDIDKEIERLQELRQETLEREQGEGSSSSK